MPLLVIGGTGTLGRQIVRKGLANYFKVRCIVRNKRTAEFLKEWGAELVYGDLTVPETLPVSFQGVTAVIDAATSRPEDDSKMVNVDWYGKLILIELAKRVNVKHYIFFSILKAEQYPYIPLMQMKSKVEEVLRTSELPYTIFKCGGFYQALIDQYAIPILDQKEVWKTSEQTSISYIDTQIAAEFCVKSLSLTQTKNKEFVLVGPEQWTSNDIIEYCESLSGQSARTKNVSLSLLKLSRQLTAFFDWSTNISDRLAFVELLQDEDDSINFNFSSLLLYKTFKVDPEKISSLDSYLREYFEMMLVTLENLTLEQQARKKNSQLNI